MLHHACALKGVTQRVEMTSDKMAPDVFVFVFRRWHNYLSHQKGWTLSMRGASTKGASINAVHHEQQSQWQHSKMGSQR